VAGFPHAWQWSAADAWGGDEEVGLEQRDASLFVSSLSSQRAALALGCHRMQ